MITCCLKWLPFTSSNCLLSEMAICCLKWLPTVSCVLHQLATCCINWLPAALNGYLLSQVATYCLKWLPYLSSSYLLSQAAAVCPALLMSRINLTKYVIAVTWEWRVRELLHFLKRLQAKTYRGGKMELSISSVCCAAFASKGDPLALPGGWGTGPAIAGGVGLALRDFAWK